jgi:predicted nucleic acid-binding protein
MKIRVVVDANPIISALIGGTSSVVLFTPKFSFITTEHTLGEVEKYIPTIAKKSGVDADLIELALSLLPLEALGKRVYRGCLGDAEKLIGKIDEKDVDVLALALHFNAPLWSEDRHFEHIKGLTLLKTKDLL